MVDREALLEECRVGWISVESDFKARLTKPESLKYALQIMGRNPSAGTIERYWSQCGGSMSFEQFSLVMQREKKTSMSDLMRAFRKIDIDGDGYITTQELQRKLTKRGEKMSADDVHAIIAEADQNGDGKLDYAEFSHMLLNISEQCVHASRKKFTKKIPELNQAINQQNSSKKYQSKSHADRKRRTSFERQERRREEIRMHLFSSNEKSIPAPPNSLHKESSEITLSNRARNLVGSDVEVPLMSDAQLKDADSDSKIPPVADLVPQSTGGVIMEKDENLSNGGKVPLETKTVDVSDMGNEHTSLPPLKKVLPVSGGKSYANEQIKKSEDGNQGIRDETEGVVQEDNAPITASIPSKPEGDTEEKQSQHEDTISSVEGARQTDHLSPSIKDGNMDREERGADIAPVAEITTALPTSVITSPPRKPKNAESWNSITGKGCFYLDLDNETSVDEPVIKCHHYRLKVPASTNVWVQMSVSSPGIQETDVLLFIFRTNENEEATEVITYTQHKINDQWVCRMDLDAGTYALIPFTSGCHLKMPDEDNEGVTSVSLVTNKENGVMLTQECQKVLEEIFHRIDLDGNGYISRTEFDFFQEITSGELCDDDAWNIIKSNFNVTKEEEITLEGFLALHEMTGADEEGGEEEVWQVLMTLGYNNQLQLITACPFLLEVLTEDCEGEIEIVDLLPFTPVIDPGFSELVSERGITESVKGAEELMTHTFITPCLTTIVVENKSSKTAHVQLDCSHSVNCISSRESTVHVVEVLANSRIIGYHLQPDDSRVSHSINFIASKILA